MASQIRALKNSWIVTVHSGWDRGRTDSSGDLLRPPCDRIDGDAHFFERFHHGGIRRQLSDCVAVAGLFGNPSGGLSREGTRIGLSDLSAAGVVYTLGGAALMADPAVQPDLSKGLATLWNPSVIGFYQLLWWVLFLYHGHSKVTTSEIPIQVEMDRT